MPADRSQDERKNCKAEAALRLTRKHMPATRH
jgi:hypothetical protein